MTEEEWLAAADPEPTLRFLTTPPSNRKLRLFCVACCSRMIEDMKIDIRVRNVIETVERFADGEVVEADVARATRDTDLSGYGAWVSACRWLSEPSAVWVAERYRAVQVAAFATKGLSELLFQHVSSIGQYDAKERVRTAESLGQADVVRCIFGNPFRPVAVDPAWLTSDVLALARGTYDEKAFDRMPILADALQDAGCDNDDVLNHCRDSSAPHVRGCWVLDLVLGKV